MVFVYIYSVHILHISYINSKTTPLKLETTKNKNCKWRWRIKIGRWYSGTSLSLKASKTSSKRGLTWSQPRSWYFTAQEIQPLLTLAPQTWKCGMGKAYLDLYMRLSKLCWFVSLVIVLAIQNGMAFLNPSFNPSLYYCFSGCWFLVVFWSSVCLIELPWSLYTVRCLNINE